MAVYTQIDNPELYFQVKLYTGTGSSNAITLYGDEDMDLTSGGMIWIKNRADRVDHRIFDAVRGASKSLTSPMMFITSALLGACLLLSTMTRWLFSIFLTTALALTTPPTSGEIMAHRSCPDFKISSLMMRE